MVVLSTLIGIDKTSYKFNPFKRIEQSEEFPLIAFLYGMIFLVVGKEKQEIMSK